MRKLRFLPKKRTYKDRRRIKPHHIHLTLASFILAGFGFALVTGTFVAKSVFVHGPHPNTLKERDNPPPATTSLYATMVTPTTPTESPSSQKSSKVKIATAPIVAGSLGIAAGGGPIYWGQGDLDNYFKDLKELGVKWVRWDVIWDVVQRNDANQYDWSAVDRVANTAKKNGITSLAIFTYAPEWARHSSCKSSKFCRPGNPADFGKFARAAAERYKGTIDHWEIWNEPNYAYLWKPSVSVQDYAAILEAGYTNIKAVNSGATVLSAGLAATGDESDGSLSPITFMTTLYNLGANKYLDHASIHPYTYPALPSHQAWWNRWQQLDPIRQMMVDRGDGHKKVWLTEFGAPTNGPGDQFAVQQLDYFDYGQDYMSEEAQKQLMEEALSLYNARSSWMGPFFWYNMRDESNDKDTTENFFGLLRHDGSKKPAYDVYKNAIR